MRNQLSATEDEFAVKTRAALLSERQLAELKSELDKRSSIANLQKVEIVALAAQVEALRERLAPTGEKPTTGVVPLVPPVPMAPSKSAPLIDQRREGAAVPLMPTAPIDCLQIRRWSTVTKAMPPLLSRQCRWIPCSVQHRTTSAVNEMFSTL